MRNASCFVILFHVDNQSYFFKEASKSNAMFVQKSLPNVSIKISHSTHECTQKG